MAKKRDDKPIHVICLRRGLREELCGYVEDERDAKRIVAERRGEVTYYTIGEIDIKDNGEALEHHEEMR